MKDVLLIIGDDLRINTEYLKYIFEQYENHFGKLGAIKFQEKDSELLFVVENLTKDFEKICICCSSESYPTMAKILATLTQSTLELNKETLIVKNAIKIGKDSFLIKLNDKFINLINATPTKKMGEILLSKLPDASYFYLIDTDKDSAKILLDPLAGPYKIKTTITQITQNLILINAIKNNKNSELEQFLQGVKNLFSQKFIDGKDIIKFIVEKLIQSSLKITFAESCTAGLCASYFAKIAGASDVFDGSLITYANRIKTEWLGVSNDILNNHGAVSKECVEQMLSGSLSASKANLSLAISGIAGPGGGSEEKPVGTIFVGAMSDDGSQIIQKLMLDGDRNYIREQSAISAYLCLLRLKPEIFFKN